jgi:hypothetical protein
LKERLGNSWLKGEEVLNKKGQIFIEGKDR